MKKLLSLSMFIMSSMMAFSQATDLIISEYAEGSGGNKKYIEIYNGTGSDVDMSSYQIWKSVNSNAWSGNLQLTGILANGTAYVIANNVTDTPGADLYSSYLSFNGDDAMALVKDPGTGYAPIDIIGIDAVDPGSGWTVAGISNATQDAILIRKSSVCSPTTDWVVSAGTNTTDSQWTIAVDPFNSAAQSTDLGIHTMACAITCDTYHTETLTACTSYTSPSGLFTWTMDGTYNDTVPNAAMCDSIITFNLTIATIYNETAAETICSGSSYTFGTQTLTTQGQFTELFSSINGCDSTVILDLSVVASYTESATAEICNGDSYTFGTQTLTTAGPYTEVFLSSTGCDSTVNLTLTVLMPTSSSITEVVCDSYTAPDGIEYTSTGIQTAVIPNMAGCDSTITIDLTVNMSSTNTVTASACDSYVANAMTYTTSGTYIQTMMNAASCDSIITFEITITPTPMTPTTSGDETYCDGDVLNDMTANGTSYDSLIISGVADATLPGGVPKCIEFFAIYDIADLSSYGFGSANNGGGTDGEEFTFPAIPLTAGSTYKVATDSANYFTFFGEYPNTLAGSSANINGDDAIELFHNGVVIDVFGDINTDGSGEAWEYLDGWAYRNDNSIPNGGVFNIGDWSFSGVNVWDGASDNATSGYIFPLGTFTTTPPVSEFNWYSDAALMNNVGTGSSLAPNGAPGLTTYYVTESIIGTSTCQGTASMINITVNSLPTMDAVANQILCANDPTAAIAFTSSDTGVTYDWTNDNASINLTATGSGDIASFNVTNVNATTETASIIVTPTANGCAGATESFTITVNPSPVLTFDAATACVYNASFTMVATPTGGTFSGIGVIGSDFDPATAGNGVHAITYNYTDANSCSASIIADITVDDCAFLEENNVNNVAIFPNPANDVITLTFDTDEAFVTIHSIQGQEVNALKVHSSEQIDTSNLVAGTYIVKVVANNSTHLQRLIVK